MEREISVTAENFIFSWNRACKDSACQFGNFFGEQGIDMVNGQAMRSALEAGKLVEDIPLGMQAPDEKTLVVKLTHPSAVFEWMMTFPLFFPIQQQFYEKWGLPYSLSPKSFLANGPCCLTNWNKDFSLTFEKTICIGTRRPCTWMSSSLISSPIQPPLWPIRRARRIRPPSTAR